MSVLGADGLPPEAKRIYADEPAPELPPAPRQFSATAARELLRAKYPSPEWAYLEEVAPRTGGASRYADAVAVALWASRGHEIVGFEIKVSRSDWLRELKQPQKAEDVFAYCDRWYVVAPADVVEVNEVPLTWGWLQLRANSIRTMKAAPALNPTPITRAFFASLMRRGLEGLDRVAHAKVIDEIAEARRDANERVRRQVADATRELKTLREHLASIREATGIELSSWGSPPIAAIKMALKLEELRAYGDHNPLGKLLQLAEQMERTAKNIREAAA